MMQINDNRGYQVLAGRHGVPDWYCWHHQQNARVAQNMRLFLRLGIVPISTTGRWRCAIECQA
jgi:hypothetical protein